MRQCVRRFRVLPAVSLLLFACGQGTGPMLLPPYDGPMKAGQENPTGYQPGSVNIFDVIGGAPGFVQAHSYEVVLAPGIDWNSANLAAQAKLRDGVPGHLATITSAEENALVEAMRSAVTTRQLWLGGFQPPGSSEPAGGWTWVKGEGAIPGTNGGPAYANWAGGEPSSPAGVNEAYLAMAGKAVSPTWSDGSWNDEDHDLIDGYVVEWDSSVGN